MTKKAKWSMAEYFHKRGIEVSDAMLEMLASNLDDLVEMLDTELDFIEHKDECIITLSGELRDIRENLNDMKSITYEYDFTEGSLDADYLKDTTKRIIGIIDDTATHLDSVLMTHGS